ncbi:fructose 1,6-bisphosphatase [Croceiramulus getboli]|nr:fructose 1,6-bisphosphatase [Flavobacteriaceae bacterium YJPT1-3]
MAKKVNGEAKATLNDPASKIEVIKNLIFGDNMAAYESEFDALKKDLEAKRQELLDFVEDTRKELDTAIDNLSTDINIRVSDLESATQERADALEEHKVDKATLGNLLVNLGEKIKNK